MRHRYGYNAQVVNWGGFWEFVPMGYIDVVPGETIEGAISLAVRSQPLNLAVDTRAYLDAFAFYMPYRLIWSGFPAWVSGESSNVQAGAAGCPMMTNLWEFNFETRFTASSGAGSTADANMPWQRGMLNTVWNRYFRRHDEPERAISANSLARVSQRPSTLETKALLGDAATVDTLINLSGTSPNQQVSLNVMRAAMAKDRFDRMRAWYGAKYVDYLAALGVELDWSLLQDPELIGQKHGDFQFVKVNQGTPTTAGAPNNVVGQTAGHFFSRVKLPIRRTFIPEHGIIGVYVAARADLVFDDPPMPAMAAKMNRAHYWSPEYESNIGSAPPGGSAAASAFGGQLPSQVFGEVTSGTIEYGFRTLLYEEYRTGQNYNRQVTNGPLYAMASLNRTGQLPPDQYIGLTSSNIGQFTQATTQQFQSVGEYRLRRFSPVRHVDLRLKLS